VSYVGGQGYEWWAQCPNEHRFTRAELIGRGVLPTECPHCGGELYLHHDITPDGLPRGSYGICGDGDIFDEQELGWWGILSPEGKVPAQELPLRLIAAEAVAA
jgi:hypothetical protein